MLIERRLLTDLGVAVDRAERFLLGLNEALSKHRIDTPLRIVHFLAQVLHESGRMRFVEENLNYSSEALLRVFAKYFTPAEAAEFARKPKKIGSRVYANRLGNGDEASGEGYLYRGRGLIQLTGKTNYRAFSRWIEDDEIVSRPKKVAEQYAVHSAVYYWDSRKLNDIADIDDVRLLTKKINGGFNGLDDRIAFLHKAKEVLTIDAVAPQLGAFTHIVNASRLNLRNRPVVAASTKIGSLSEGTEVSKVAAADVEGWVKIRATLNGQVVTGFVSRKFLKPIPRSAPLPPPPTVDFEIPAVHLSKNNATVTRMRDGGRAHPLGEPGRPRRTGRTVAAKTRQLIEIVRYLDSEDGAHLRYKPKRGTTYCNIYACDLCYLAEVYLPRVWWSERALRQIRDRHEVPVKYGDTVRELNANMLHDWLEDYGRGFGWKAVTDLDQLQIAANRGEVGLIVGQRNDLERPGHVAAVVPEHDDFKTTRSSTGLVLKPLSSQAGSKNHRFFAQARWWTSERFQSFGFWRHA